MHGTDVVIVIGADLEYTHKNIHSFMVNDAVLEYYILKRTKIKVRITINHDSKKSARLTDKTNSWKDCIQIIIHVWQFFMCKTFQIYCSSQPI